MVPLLSLLPGVDFVRTNSSISQQPKSSVAMRPSKSTSIQVATSSSSKSHRDREREKTRTPTCRPQPRRAHHRYLYTYISERHRIVESHQPNTRGLVRCPTICNRDLADPMRRRHEPLSCPQPPILRPPPRTPSRVVGMGTRHRTSAFGSPSTSTKERFPLVSFTVGHGMQGADVCLPVCLRR